MTTTEITADASAHASGDEAASLTRLLSAIASLHQLCIMGPENAEEVAFPLVRDSLLPIQHAMESLEQVLKQSELHNNAPSSSNNDKSSTEEIVLEITFIEKQVKKLQTLVKKLLTTGFLRPILKGPIWLSKIRAGLSKIRDVLSISAESKEFQAFWEGWEARDAQLKKLVDLAEEQKDLMVTKHDSSFGNPSNTARLCVLLGVTSDADRNKLIQLLEKQRNYCEKQLQDNAMDHKSREKSQEELDFVDNLLKEIRENRHSTFHGSSHHSGLAAKSFDESSLQTGNSYRIHVESTEADVPSWALCSLTKTLMTDPVTVCGPCGHTVNKSVFRAWIDQPNQERAKTCPVCGKKLVALMAKSNLDLKWKIKSMAQQRSLQCRVPAERSFESDENKHLSHCGHSRERSLSPPCSWNSAGDVVVRLDGSQHAPGNDSLITLDDFSPNASASSLNTSSLQSPNYQQYKMDASFASLIDASTASTASIVRFNPVVKAHEPPPQQHYKAEPGPPRQPRVKTSSRKKEKKGIFSLLTPSSLKSKRSSLEDQASSDSAQAYGSPTTGGKLDVSGKTANTLDMSSSVHSRRSTRSLPPPPPAKSCLKKTSKYAAPFDGPSPVSQASKRHSNKLLGRKASNSPTPHSRGSSAECVPSLTSMKA